MSKTYKSGTKMDLNTFNQSVQQSQSAKRQVSSLSDRLKNKDNLPPAPARFKRSLPQVKKNTEYEIGAHFPVLVPVNNLPVQGAWQNGIAGIIAAIDLPDPAIAEKALKNSLRSVKPVNQHYYGYYDDYNEMPIYHYDSEEEIYPTLELTSVVHVTSAVDNVDWAEL